MSLLGSLGKLLGRAGNTINNDVLQPVHRAEAAVISPLQTLLGVNRNTPTQAPDFQRTPPARPSAPNALNSRSLGGNVPWEAVYPQSQTRAGADAVNQANRAYGFTPRFQGVLNSTWPIVTPDNLSGGGTLTADTQAAGLYLNNPTASRTNIVTNNQYVNPEVIQHEGLHAAWHRQPQTQQQFQQAYNQSATPALKKYLAYRLQDYNVYKNNPSLLDNISKAPDPLQTEVHSYIPSYYDQTAQPMPVPLNNYYSQFYNTQLPRQQTAELSSINRLMPSMFPDNTTSAPGGQ